MSVDDDKRRHLRLAKNFRVEIREFRFPLARQKFFQVQCGDISEGGLLLESPQRFEAGVKLQVKIFIPSFNKYHPSFFKVFESDAGQYLQAIAEVVREQTVIPLTRYDLGVRFLDVDYDDWNALRNFIGRSL